MAKKIRITRKTLKEDEVRSFWVHGHEWLNVNRKPLLIGLGVLVVGLIFVGAFRTRSARQTSRANSLVSQAQMEIQQALFAQEDQSRSKAFADAANKLEEVRTRFSGADVAPFATYLLGNAAFFQNDYERAATLYEEYIEEVGNAIDKADGNIALGYALENQAFWTQGAENAAPEAQEAALKKAQGAYKEAEALAKGRMQEYQAKLGRARILELHAGTIDEARKLYAEVAAARKLEPPKHAKEPRTIQEMLVRQAEQNRRLFTLGETARLRHDRLEAEQ